MYTNNNRKGTLMKSIYIKRRIAVVLIPVALILAIIGMGKVANQPAFTCQTTTVEVGHQMIWNIADKYCSGDITLAAKQIMKDNGIKGEDLRTLSPITIISIKGDK